MINQLSDVENTVQEALVFLQSDGIVMIAEATIHMAKKLVTNYI